MLMQVVSELEDEFPGRRFTLDGHLLGSIGEVLAEYYYGINLYPPSEAIHDGWVGDRKIQIKITQRDTILLGSKPDYLIVLSLNKDGRVLEVFNGPGGALWDKAGKEDRHHYKHIRIKKLMEFDKNICDADRIPSVHEIEKKI